MVLRRITLLRRRAARDRQTRFTITAQGRPMRVGHPSVEVAAQLRPVQPLRVLRVQLTPEPPAVTAARLHLEAETAAKAEMAELHQPLVPQVLFQAAGVVQVARLLLAARTAVRAVTAR